MADAPMTAGEIAHLLADRIQELYSQPWVSAGDAGELDTVLGELHWWYAKVTDQVDHFAQVRAKEPAHHFRVRMKWRESQAPIDSPGISELIDTWKSIDKSLGWDWST